MHQSALQKKNKKDNESVSFPSDLAYHKPINSAFAAL